MKTRIILIIIFSIFAACLFLGCSKNDIYIAKIKLDGQDIKTPRKSLVEIEENKIIIVSGGKYHISGAGENIQIKINTAAYVEIYLEDIDVHNKDITFINAKSKGEIKIISIGENENSVVVYGEDKVECIKSKGAISIEGDTLLLLDGHNCIDADEIDIDADIQLIAKGDAIKADKININSGSINIVSGNNCIEGDEIYIYSGNIALTGSEDDSRGIYAEKDTLISGGNIFINTVNDGISSQNSIFINGGEINISTSDDAIHADDEIQIDGGKIKIEKCLEGLESAVVSINGGEIEINASNDGLNAAQSEKNNNKSADIFINGGSLKINAEGDGIDANGSIYINGGIVFVSGSADDENNALDFDADLLIKGGTVIAAGNSKNAKLPYNKGIQNTIFLKFQNMQTPYKNIVIYDSSYNTILLADLPKAYNCIVFSENNLIDGQIYYLGILNDNLISNDYTTNTNINMNDVNLIGEFTIDDGVEWVNISD